MATRDDKPNEAAASGGGVPLWLLALTVILCGSGVIMLEVLGSRIVGPFFGVSLYIWTALISVALISLSLGYWLGGIVADRYPVAKGLYSVITAAIVTTLLIPLYDRELCLWASNQDRFDIQAGVLLASCLLFLPPLTFLGFVSPYAIRLALPSVQRAGRTAGFLYALSTAGSVVGSILTGFYLVPMLGVTVTLFLIAVVLAIPCVLWALVGRMPMRAVTTVALTVVLGVGGVLRTEARPYANTDNVRLLYESEGRYARIGISETRRIQGDPTSEWVRWIMIDGIPQTGVIPESNFENYTPLHNIQTNFYRLHGIQPRTALVLGLGGGAVPMALINQGVAVEVVDIDPLVVEAATEWMGFDPERVPVHLMDARAFIRQCDRQFDLVIFDIATGGNQPFHLFSQEMFQETDRVLAPGGVVAINYIGFVHSSNDFLTRAVLTTVTSVFEESTSYIFPPANRRQPEDLCNIMFFFGHSPMRDDEAIRRDSATSAADRRLLSQGFLPLQEELNSNGVILTDDRNPIERYSVRINETWRRQVFSQFRRELNRL